MGQRSVGQRVGATVARLICAATLIGCGFAVSACTQVVGPTGTTLATVAVPSGTTVAVIARDGVELRVRAITLTTLPAPTKTPSPDAVPVLAVDIQLVNVGRHGVPFSGSYFTLTDAQGREYAPIGIATSRLATSVLGTGEEVHGMLSFPSDPASHGLVLRYDPLRFAQEHNLAVDDDMRAVSPLLVLLEP